MLQMCTFLVTFLNMWAGPAFFTVFDAFSAPGTPKGGPRGILAPPLGALWESFWSLLGHFAVTGRTRGATSVPWGVQGSRNDYN